MAYRLKYARVLRMRLPLFHQERTPHMSREQHLPSVAGRDADSAVRIRLISSGALAAAVLAALAATAPSAHSEPVEGTHLFAIEVTGTPEGLLGAAGVPMRDATNTELVLDVIEHVDFLNRSPAGVEFYAETRTPRPTNIDRLGGRPEVGVPSRSAIRTDSPTRLLGPAARMPV